MIIRIREERSIVFKILSISLFIVATSCMNDGDRLEGHSARDPNIDFYKAVARFDTTYQDTFYSPLIIDNYRGEKEIYLIVGEYNRSDGKPCPAKGKDLLLTIESSKGEYETYYLNSSLPTWLQWQDNITPYIKIIYPILTNTIIQNNGIIEINNEQDTIFAYYNSYWHNNPVQAKLIHENPIKEQFDD